jgi:hypothetical protein
MMARRLWPFLVLPHLAIFAGEPAPIEVAPDLLNLASDLLHRLDTSVSPT